MPNESLSLSESRDRRNQEALKDVIRTWLDDRVAELEAEINTLSSVKGCDDFGMIAGMIRDTRDRIAVIRWLQTYCKPRKTHRPRRIKSAESYRPTEDGTP